MKNTFQTSNIDMLEHGLMVNKSYSKILKKEEEYTRHFDFNDDDLNSLLNLQYDVILMRHYQIYHDCGKPFCQERDENGKPHYPNHAEKSAEIHQQYFDCEIANKLIKNDMIFHSLKSEDLTQWILSNDINLIASLYLTAWSELFANSLMFGGVNSDSFKIKKKKLNKSFKKIKELLNAD